MAAAAATIAACVLVSVAVGAGQSNPVYGFADIVGASSSGAPAAIASANIGCIAHLQGGTATPVAHWIELLDRRLGE